LDCLQYAEQVILAIQVMKLQALHVFGSCTTAAGPPLTAPPRIGSAKQEKMRQLEAGTRDADQAMLVVEFVVVSLQDLVPRYQLQQWRTNLRPTRSTACNSTLISPRRLRCTVPCWSARRPGRSASCGTAHTCSWLQPGPAWLALHATAAS
jgi:hypothetical protein